MKALIGRTLGNYQIVEEIGRGSKAIVYKAVQPTLQRYIAIKVVPPRFTSDTTFMQRFQREAVTAARLRHPHIVTIYDVGEQDGLYYIVMEYLEGMTLAELIQQQGLLPLDKVAHIAQQIASALDYAHCQGFIHRDVKPGNVIVGLGDHATLTDFGIVKAVAGTTLTQTGMMIGTPQYMSPEQVEGREIDHRTDIYSLGVVCYEMLTGQAPFGGEILAILHAHVYEPPPPIRSLRSDLPVKVETAINQALAKEPEARYASAMQFVQALATTGEVTEPATLVAFSLDQGAGVERLIAELDSDDKEVRTNARERLVEIGGPAVEPLIQALRHKERRVRWNVARALGMIGDARAVEPLNQSLRDAERLARWSVAWALGMIGDARAVEPLIGLLSDPTARVRWEAAGALGKIGDARAIEPLIGLLQDLDADVCRGAAGALGKIGDARAVGPLIDLLRAPDAAVCRGAAGALSKIGGPAVEPLIRLLWDPDADVRWRAAKALGEIGDAWAVEPLISLLRDPDAAVRRGATGALGKISDRRALPYLRWVAENDADSIVRSAAQEAIERMQEKAPGQESDRTQIADQEPVTFAVTPAKAGKDQPLLRTLERAAAKLKFRLVGK